MKTASIILAVALLHYLTAVGTRVALIIEAAGPSRQELPSFEFISRCLWYPMDSLGKAMDFQIPTTFALLVLVSLAWGTIVAGGMAAGRRSLNR